MTPNIQQKITAALKIEDVIQKNYKGKIGNLYRKRDELFNRILLDFGKEYGIKNLNPNNSPRYKGNFRPYLENAVVIYQKHYTDFMVWICSKNS